MCSHTLFMAISLSKLWVRGVSDSVSHDRDARSDRNQGRVVGVHRRFTNEDRCVEGHGVCHPSKGVQWPREVRADEQAAPTQGILGLGREMQCALAFTSVLGLGNRVLSGGMMLSNTSDTGLSAVLTGRF